MTVAHPCPACGKRMYLDRVHEGHRVPCPHCGHRFEVPVGAVSAPAPEPAPESETEERGYGTPVEEPTPREERVARVVDVDPMPPSRPARGVGDRPRAPSVQRADAPRPPDHDDGVMLLILGIAGITCCNVLAPVAWAVGSRSRRRTFAAGGEPAGLVTAGWILGIVGTVLLLASFAMGLGSMVFSLSGVL